MWHVCRKEILTGLLVGKSEEPLVRPGADGRMHLKMTLKTWGGRVNAGLLILMIHN
jgi:hypothetical protein